MKVWEARQRLNQWSHHDLPRWWEACLPDVYVQKSQFRRVFGRSLNLASPATFNEKLHWLSRHYRDPVMTELADKYSVRAFVEKRAGSEYLNELYGVWEDPSVIPFDRLPGAFALKVTSGSGQNILCRDRLALDRDATIRQLAKWMKHSEYWVSREWAYKDIRARVIAESLLLDESGDVPQDYKFFCFDGVPRFIQVDTGRFTDHRRDLFDLDWQKLPVTYTYPCSDAPLLRPRMLDAMLDLAAKLSQGFPFVRVDLYNIGDSIKFGEMTWYPGGGLERFSPSEYDFVFGEAVTLPQRRRPRGFGMFGLGMFG
ncbi:conserved protein of unknown function [Nitrospira japonica]|uniref:Uncharacterized protein n=1 Tax=Nitrospira japonica TaxID=1325564 RepID=A0A1W1I7W2_9BACT|nr:ATP-grasp fold amidoligase family protein [Nitrospira japonica]SLM49011.1 conserved protein of unknown function [Nitrospira japonica]